MWSLNCFFDSSRSIALPGVYQRRLRRRRLRQRQEPQPEQPGGGGGEEDEEAEAELERKEERHHEEHKQDQEQALKVKGGEEAIATLYCISEIIVASNMRLKKQIIFFLFFQGKMHVFFIFGLFCFQAQFPDQLERPGVPRRPQEEVGARVRQLVVLVVVCGGGGGGGEGPGTGGGGDERATDLGDVGPEHNVLHHSEH